MSKVDYTNGRYSYTPPTDAENSASAAEKERRAQLEKTYDYQKNNAKNSIDYDALNKTAREINSMDAQGSNAVTGLSNSQQNWNSALDMTQGRGDATMNDPRVGAALDLLQQHTQAGPYTDQVVNQQANRMADRTSAMAGNQAESLRTRAANSGGNVNDPSYQAAMNQANTGRMQQNNADRGDLETSATLNNYREQGNAAGQLGNMRMGQLGMANNQYNQAGQMYANQQQSSGHSNALNSGNQGGNQSLGYKTPQYSPADWSAITDAINNSGGNGSYSQPQGTQATQGTQPSYGQDMSQAGQSGVTPSEPNRPVTDSQSTTFGHNQDDYTGADMQAWAAANGGNQAGSQPQPSPSPQPMQTNDYQVSSGRDAYNQQQRQAAIARSRYTYNPSN